MADFVGAIDQGTTSTRFMIFDHDGNEVGHPPARARADPAAGRLGRAQPGRRSGSAPRRSIRTALSKHNLSASDLAAVGITNQRETTVVWDRKTGRPLLQRDRLAGHPHRPDRLRAGARGQGRRHPAQGRPAAGDVLLRRQDPVDPGERRRGPRGRRARRRVFGNTDCWVLWNLTGGADGGVARHRRDQRQPDHADEPGDARLGRRAARRSSTSRGRCCRRSGRRPTRTRYGMHPAGRPVRRRGRADRRPRRPAGGHRRPGLLRPRRGQEHLRHRQLHAAQHRHRAGPVEQRAC